MRINGVVSLVLVLFVSNCENCGLRKTEYFPLVTHGFETEPGSYPWHAAIYHQEANERSYKCGGTLIGENIILTAAHCAYDKLGRIIIPQRMILLLGKHNLLNLESQAREFRAHSIKLHPDYDVNTYANDIAKVKLNGNVEYSVHIQPICLWDSNRRSVNEMVNRIGTIVGWGFTEKDKSSDVLREATMPIVSFKTCFQSKRDFFGHFWTDTTFCAGYRNGTSVCNGDSGGGMYFEEHGIWKLRGIVSISTSRANSTLCSTTDYVLFTDSAQYLKWINEPYGLLGCPNGNHSKDAVNVQEVEFPWEASLYNGTDFCCSTTLISASALLTRASCRCLTTTSDSLRIGMILRNIKDQSKTYYDVSNVKLHEGFNKDTQENDLAVIYLKSEVPFNQNTQPVCFPSSSTSDQIEQLYVAGINTTSNKVAILKMFNEKHWNCQLFYTQEITEYPLNEGICTTLSSDILSTKIRSTLIGSSGEGWYLRGLNVNKLAPESPYFLFTDINKHVEWILKAIAVDSEICGKRIVPKSRSSLINRGEFPWHAMIYFGENRVMQLACGGTLINKNTILTVASCFYDLDVEKWTFKDRSRFVARLGVHKVHQVDSFAEELPIFKIVTHPDFHPNLLWNDIGIAVLANDVTFTNYIQPACFWNPLKTTNLGSEEGVIVSFGRQLYGGADGPERISVPIVDKTECSDSELSFKEINLYYTTNFCAVWQRDSNVLGTIDVGVGLIYEVDQVPFVRGLLSWGILNNGTKGLSNKYAVFVDPEPYLPWIRNEINKI